MERAVRLLLAGVVVVLLGCLAGAVCAARAQAYAPYRIPAARAHAQPRPPCASCCRAPACRRPAPGSSCIWQGSPYQDRLSERLPDGAVVRLRDPGRRRHAGQRARTMARTVARRYIWPRVPLEYRSEMRGIANGMHAAGYPNDTLWDVVAANAWADEACYATLLAATAARAAIARRRHARRPHARARAAAAPLSPPARRPPTARRSWVTTPGRSTSGAFMYNVMFYVHPLKGYAFSYQSAGGEIWSGQDWYENSAGLLLTETTLADTVYTPKRHAGVRAGARGGPVRRHRRPGRAHARARNNGAYSNEWLIGDATGTIASLQLGGKVYDLHETQQRLLRLVELRLGRQDARRRARPRRRLGARRLQPRCGRLRALPALGTAQDPLPRQDRRHGRQDHGVGHLRHLSGKAPADARDLCGEPEHATPGLRTWDSWVPPPGGRDRRQGLHRGHGAATACSRGPAGGTAAATTSAPPVLAGPSWRATTARWRCSASRPSRRRPPTAG